VGSEFIYIKKLSITHTNSSLLSSLIVFKPAMRSYFIAHKEKKSKIHKRKRDRMRCNSFLKIPKEQEQAVPDTVVTQFSNTKEEAYANGDIDVMDELEGILGIEEWYWKVVKW